MENVILIAYVVLSLLVILAGLRWIIAIARLALRLVIGLLKLLINTVMLPVGLILKIFKA